MKLFFTSAHLDPGSHAGLCCIDFHAAVARAAECFNVGDVEPVSADVIAVAVGKPAIHAWFRELWKVYALADDLPLLVFGVRDAADVALLRELGGEVWPDLAAKVQ